MKTLSVTDQNEPLQFEDKSIPATGKNEVLVELKAAALNHRDQWIRQGMYPNIQLGTTLGSDGAGLISAVGEGVSESFLKKEVIINPNLNWGEDLAVQSGEFNILGMPKDGTLAEYVVVNIDRVVEKPKHLSFEQAAALPLAGLTAYRALFHHGHCERNDQVLISGVGGGVAQFAFLFALSVGAKVWVTSGSNEKISKCVELGAQDGFNYKEEDLTKKARSAGGFDIVIDSAGGNQINDFVKLMKPAGRVVFYGATNGLPEKIDLFKMFWNQITLQGSTMGNDKEFESMVKFISKHKIEPIIDSVRPFEEAVSAFDTMKEGKQFGKLVLTF